MGLLDRYIQPGTDFIALLADLAKRRTSLQQRAIQYGSKPEAKPRAYTFSPVDGQVPIVGLYGGDEATRAQAVGVRFPPLPGLGCIVQPYSTSRGVRCSLRHTDSTSASAWLWLECGSEACSASAFFYVQEAERSRIPFLGPFGGVLDRCRRGLQAMAALTSILVGTAKIQQTGTGPTPGGRFVPCVGYIATAQGHVFTIDPFGVLRPYYTGTAFPGGGRTTVAFVVNEDGSGFLQADFRMSCRWFPGRGNITATTVNLPYPTLTTDSAETIAETDYTPLGLGRDYDGVLYAAYSYLIDYTSGFHRTYYGLVLFKSTDGGQNWSISVVKESKAVTDSPPTILNGTIEVKTNRVGFARGRNGGTTVKQGTTGFFRGTFVNLDISPPQPAAPYDEFIASFDPNVTPFADSEYNYASVQLADPYQAIDNGQLTYLVSGYTNDGYGWAAMDAYSTSGWGGTVANPPPPTPTYYYTDATGSWFGGGNVPGTDAFIPTNPPTTQAIPFWVGKTASGYARIYWRQSLVMQCQQATALTFSSPTTSSLTSRTAGCLMKTDPLVLADDEQIVVATQYHGGSGSGGQLVHSIDEGATWTDVDMTPMGSELAYALSYGPCPPTGYVLDVFGNIWRIKDDGTIVLQWQNTVFDYTNSGGVEGFVQNDDSSFCIQSNQQDISASYAAFVIKTNANGAAGGTQVSVQSLMAPSSAGNNATPLGIGRTADGTIYAGWRQPASGLGTVYILKSTNGGSSWTSHDTRTVGSGEVNYVGPLVVHPGTDHAMILGWTSVTTSGDPHDNPQQAGFFYGDFETQNFSTFGYYSLPLAHAFNSNGAAKYRNFSFGFLDTGESWFAQSRPADGATVQLTTGSTVPTPTWGYRPVGGSWTIGSGLPLCAKDAEFVIGEDRGPNYFDYVNLIGWRKKNQYAWTAWNGDSPPAVYESSAVSGSYGLVGNFPSSWAYSAGGNGFSLTSSDDVFMTYEMAASHDGTKIAIGQKLYRRLAFSADGGLTWSDVDLSALIAMGDHNQGVAAVIRGRV